MFIQVSRRRLTFRWWQWKRGTRVRTSVITDKNSCPTAVRELYQARISTNKNSSYLLDNLRHTFLNVRTEISSSSKHFQISRETKTPNSYPIIFSCFITGQESPFEIEEEIVEAWLSRAHLRGSVHRNGGLLLVMQSRILSSERSCRETSQDRASRVHPAPRSSIGSVQPRL